MIELQDENRDARLICFLVWFINHFYFYCRWKGRHPEKVIYQMDKFTAVKGQAKNLKVKFRHIYITEALEVVRMN